MERRIDPEHFPSAFVPSLVENRRALERFASLPLQQRRQFLARVGTADTDEEVRGYINALTAEKTIF